MSHLCPLGCEMREYRISGWATGMLYGCMGGKSDGAIFAPEYSGWVCKKAWFELKKTRENGTAPAISHELVENTRTFRAGLRPQYMSLRGAA